MLLMTSKPIYLFIKQSTNEKR